MTVWTYITIGYVSVAVLTLAPTIMALLAPVKLNPGGASFESAHFSDEGRERLTNHYGRIAGTLGYWKREAAKYGRFHYYCLAWTIISSALMPFLTQAIDVQDPTSKWLLTAISAHVAITLSFHRGLKVPEHYKAFRHGESEFYDLYRRMLDQPDTMGSDETEQIKRYFNDVEALRKFIRTTETDSLPSIEDTRASIAKTTSPK